MSVFCVPRSLQSWVSVIVLTADVFNFSFNYSIRRTHSWRFSTFKKVEKRQLWVRPIEWLKLNFAICVLHQTRSLDVLILSFLIWFLWTKTTMWSIILSFTKKKLQEIVRACSMFYPYEGYRSVTPLDDARVNRTIFHNPFSARIQYYITLIEGRDYYKQDIITSHTWYGQQNPHRGRW